MPLDHEQLVAMYRALSGTRIAEQTITDLNKSGVLRGHHSGLGHEAVGVAVGMAVRPDDCVQMSHRSGMMLSHARGGYSLREAVLSQFGRAPSHYASLPGRPRTLTIVGLVGTWVPMSVGISMADRLRGKDTVTVTFFGDGAANEGAVHEAMNLAGARRLPMVFLIENNGMAVSMPTSEATAASDFAARAAGYGMPGVLVDGHDPVALHEVAEEAVARARRGQGPTLIEAKLIRWESHANGIADLRTPEEIEEAHRRDGVRQLRDALIGQGILSEADADAIDDAARAEVDAAVEEGRTAGFDMTVPPPMDAADAWRLTYAN
ncbi:MAG: thiamine pyrophosphate-dependent dehydrogenase E1 component subunit alpha [Dehalococcoidia bacterium]|nr:thiamine pyrophosphate-dependent dehydrogenase E1 component subunit alpha [Dehalococcoidia bacterium]